MLSLALMLSLTAAPNLVGKWQGDGFTLVLDASGSGTISDGPGVPAGPLKWKVNGTTLLLTEDGETTPYAMKLGAKDTMTLSSEVLDHPITLKRGGAAASAPVADTTTPQKPAADAFVPGTCESACKHYLGCAKLKGDDQMALCQYNCFASGANAYQLGVYNQLDCKRAIFIVVAAQLQALQKMQSGNGNGGGNAKGSRCSGCVRDGNDCVWISQSNWGTGNNSPYSGAVSSCDADCCQ